MAKAREDHFLGKVSSTHPDFISFLQRPVFHFREQNYVINTLKMVRNLSKVQRLIHGEGSVSEYYILLINIFDVVSLNFNMVYLYFPLGLLSFWF